MADERSSGNGSIRWPQPGVPLIVVLVSVVVAVGAVSALLWVLFAETTGPGEVLRDYYEVVNAGDCDGSVGFLSNELRASIDGDGYCEWVEREAAGRFSPEFRIDSVLLRGEPETVAVVAIRYPGSDQSLAIAWTLERIGDTWRVDSFPFSDLPFL
jgi:hypothetical protein